ncbi:hypothetical protein [Actinacidiphila sp. ITFR-21]|uniref:hypothetical protein n=1 Tax=Actinacidiphila sp. ITFR-21 TaxID=3075199 RepID=UPI00288C3B8B|nr:hypothetical protein [Streptomyces sp. ITFR-21]WNI15233.1 hypothetical protein RLT57_06570 [Streptomyces sp. ITFR-21]
MTVRKKWDLLGNAALVMAIVGTAAAEYKLARESGWGYVSFALPGALDVYAVRSMRVRKDMALMAGVMFAVNAVSHLVSAGLLSASWPVVVAVSALPILVLVRVHAISDSDPTPTGPEMEGVPQVEGAADSGSGRSRVEVPAEPAPEPVVLERVPEPQVTGSTLPADLREAPVLGPLVPVAELLAGTSRDQQLSPIGEGTELAAEPPEPEPVVPEPEPEPAAGSGGVPPERVRTVREWLAAEPELTGTEIGRRFGTSDSYGRRIKKIATGGVS